MGNSISLFRDVEEAFNLVDWPKECLGIVFLLYIRMWALFAYGGISLNSYSAGDSPKPVRVKSLSEAKTLRGFFFIILQYNTIQSKVVLVDSDVRRVRGLPTAFSLLSGSYLTHWFMPFIWVHY